MMRMTEWDIDLVAGNRAGVRLSLSRHGGNEEVYLEFDDLDDVKELAKRLEYQAGCAAYLRMREADQADGVPAETLEKVTPAE